MKNIRWVFAAAVMVAISFQASAQQDQVSTNTPIHTQQIESDYHPDDLVTPITPTDKQTASQMTDGRPVRVSGDGVPALAVPDEKRSPNNSQKYKSENKPR